MAAGDMKPAAVAFVCDVVIGRASTLVNNKHYLSAGRASYETMIRMASPEWTSGEPT